MPIDVIQNSILVSDTYCLKQSLILRLLSCIEAQAIDGYEIPLFLPFVVRNIFLITFFNSFSMCVLNRFDPRRGKCFQV